ncbi:hypothetical protein [Magnetospira sp. QH-2]|uniref:hypothetical protein n=1 Tax=Magnetospira sp. (strain QH-2) TaxID=1288970 RepID=UPI0003E81AC2|nr:hypothetical protein [Magnetospira sp. QH-2]CCQ72258.1 conserved protein of unknown function [Magnetospira sp. QH-2]
MTESSDSKTQREIIGLIADRAAFEDATRDLLDAGFEKPDLSVLSSHDSLEAAESSSGSWSDAITALVGEYKVVGPLVASGGIFLAGGPVAATVGAIVGAAVSGIAAKEVLDEVTSSHQEDFQRALDAGGLILWVRVTDAEKELQARDILARHGATNIHLHEAGAAD